MTTYLNNKPSIKVPFQLPEFLRVDDNYQTFIAFIKAYYEWAEQSDIKDSANSEGAIYGSQNLLNYNDIDFSEDPTSFNRFIDYFFNNFLPSFPTECLTDKAKLIKIGKQFYSTKGTSAAYKFIFRAIYNSDVELFPTGEAVLRASDGKWYITKSLKIDSNDEQFLGIDNLRLFGETSKSFAVVERSRRVDNKIEVYISTVERVFQSGEYIRVVDDNNQNLYFKNGEIVAEGTSGATLLRAKVLGSISSLKVNPEKRGLLYLGQSAGYPGDPVVFYGGLNPNTSNPISANAYVYEATLGSLDRLDMVNGSYGYRMDPNTFISITGGGGTGAVANVVTVDPAGLVRTTWIPQDYLSNTVRSQVIGSAYTIFPANTGARVSCTLANAFTFTGFSTYPIGGVLMRSGGSGYRKLPKVKPLSLYDTTSATTTKGILGNLGILGPIKISDGGTGYANGDYIKFTGNDYNGGVGANATVTVNASGTIISVDYNYANTNPQIKYPKGGLGYIQNKLPNLTVVSANGARANLYVSTVLGEGAQINPVMDARGIGQIVSFRIENYGEDYISQPKVSLKVRDIIVSNIEDRSKIARTGEIVFQGANVNSYVFKANVDSIKLVQAGATRADDKYLLRVYNYTSNTKTDRYLTVTRSNSANLYMNVDTSYTTVDSEGEYVFKNGIRTYGNGLAEATAKFLGGIIIGNGQYLNEDGFPSSFQVLESEDYNSFTYQLKVQKSFEAYRTVLYRLLHPAGTKVKPITTIKANTQEIIVHREAFVSNSHALSYYTGTTASNVAMYATFENPSNNIIKFSNLSGATLSNIIQTGARISFTYNGFGPNVYSEIISVSNASNTAVIKDNVYLRFANVAYANLVNSSSKITLPSLTGRYDLINNGEYNYPLTKVRDIFCAGDKIRVGNSANIFYQGTVTYVSYSNNVLFVTPSVNIATNTANSLLISTGRDIQSDDVFIYNSLGTVFYPELTTEAGDTITTQNGTRLILG
jgi:hypothetical protein